MVLQTYTFGPKEEAFFRDPCHRRNFFRRPGFGEAVFG
jgi:hypothetical protein